MGVPMPAPCWSRPPGRRRPDGSGPSSCASATSVAIRSQPWRSPASSRCFWHLLTKEQDYFWARPANCGGIAEAARSQGWRAGRARCRSPRFGLRLQRQGVTKQRESRGRACRRADGWALPATRAEAAHGQAKPISKHANLEFLRSGSGPRVQCQCLHVNTSPIPRNWACRITLHSTLEPERST